MLQERFTMPMKHLISFGMVGYVIALMASTLSGIGGAPLRVSQKPRYLISDAKNLHFLALTLRPALSRRLKTALSVDRCSSNVDLPNNKDVVDVRTDVFKSVHWSHHLCWKMLLARARTIGR